MFLRHLVTLYASDHDYGISPGARAQLLYAVGSLERHLGRPAEVADLTDATVNGWIDAMRAVRSPHTVRSQRGSVLTLWRWAWQEGHLDQPPRKVRRLRMPQPAPHAWTAGQVTRLVQRAAKLPGRVRGSAIRRGPHLVAWLRVAWDSGLRLGDQHALRAPEIAQDGRLDCVQHKTGLRVVVRLWPDTVAVVADTLADAPREVIFPFAKRWYQKQVANLAAAEGLAGSHKCIRRGVGTAAEVAGGYGSQMLGHADARTLRYYFDRDQLEPVVAPRLPDGQEIGPRRLVGT